MQRPISINVDLDRLTLFALIVVGILFALNIFLGFLKFIDHDGPLFELMHFFDASTEMNFTTWYSSLLLTTAGVGGLVAAQKAATREIRRGYIIAGGLLLIMSLDETGLLHDRLDGVVLTQLPSSPAWAENREWVVIGIPIVLLIGLIMIRLIRNFPSGPRWGLIIGAAIFFGGAIGFELIAVTFQRAMGPGVLSNVSTNIEESMEMIGAIVWARTTLLVAQNDSEETSLRSIFKLAMPSLAFSGRR